MFESYYFDFIVKSISLNPNEIQEAEAKRVRLENIFSNNSPKATLYIQGSFAYGTAVKPIVKDKDGDFDLDLVCDVKKSYDKAEELKNDVGNIIKKSNYYQYLTKEGKRCWTLEFERFHIDLLPSQLDKLKGGTFIQITHKDLNTLKYSFKSSNPLGLLKWFKDINDSYFSEKNNQKSILFEKNKSFFTETMLYNNWHNVEDRFLSSKLQNTIKILKRHRDILFVNKSDEDYKPISIIINILSAKIAQLYKPTTTFNFIKAFINHVMELFDNNKNHYSLKNPADSNEILTDRWHENDYAREKAFMKWIDSLKKLMYELENSSDNNYDQIITKYFGEDAMKGFKLLLEEDKKSKKHEIKPEKMPKPWNQ